MPCLDIPFIEISLFHNTCTILYIFLSALYLFFLWIAIECKLLKCYIWHLHVICMHQADSTLGKIINYSIIVTYPYLNACCSWSRGWGCGQGVRHQWGLPSDHVLFKQCWWCSKQEKRGLCSCIYLIILVRIISGNFMLDHLYIYFHLNQDKDLNVPFPFHPHIQFSLYIYASDWKTKSTVTGSSLP